MYLNKDADLSLDLSKVVDFYIMDQYYLVNDMDDMAFELRNNSDLNLRLSLHFLRI